MMLLAFCQQFRYPEPMAKFIRRIQAWFRVGRIRFMRLPLLARIAITGFGVATLVIAVLVTAQLTTGYYDALANTRARLTQNTYVMSAYLDRTLAALEQYGADARPLAVGRDMDLAKLARLQGKLQRYMPIVVGMAVFDANGKSVFGHEKLLAGLNIPRSAVWAATRTTRTDDSEMGQTVAAPDGALYLPVMWRLTDAHGQFAGELALILNLQKLRDFLPPDEKEDKNNMALSALYRADGQGLMMLPDNASYLGQNHRDSLLFSKILPESKAGFATIHWALARNDAPAAQQKLPQEWLVAYEKLPAAPLVVAQLIRKDIATGTWPTQRAAFLLLGLGAMVLLMGVTIMIVRQAFQQQRTAADLQAARERYDLAVAGTNDGIWDWNLVTNEIYFSPVWLRILGYQPNELSAETSTWTDNIHPEDIESAYRKLQAHLDGESDMFRDTHRMRQKDGSYIWIEARARVVRDVTGHAVRMVGTISNVEQRKRYELALKAAKDQAEAANVSKSRFLAIMSHELRTPLNGIIGFSEITRDQLFGPVGSPKYLEYANDIHNGATHLLSLINDILDFSKIDAGKMDLSLRPMDVRATLEHVLRMMRTVAIEKQITLHLDAPRELPALVADDRALRQMLLNLLSNAVKFSESTRRVTLQVVLPPAGGMDIAVLDQGKGIPPEYLDKIFEPFEQVDDIMTRTHKGTGLGLPLVKALIELHGGEVRLVSEAGKGTTVTLHFPVRSVVGDNFKKSA